MYQLQFIIPIIGKDGVTSSLNIRVTLTDTNQWRMHSVSYRIIHYSSHFHLLLLSFSNVLSQKEQSELEISISKLFKLSCAFEAQLSKVHLLPFCVHHCACLFRANLYFYIFLSTICFLSFK